ncbi:uncharacterized protein PG986_012670 [Apiospora aurea]|uniref:Cyclochlorotine biosynthesis protein O n=1 Tax=Apiospora aurea TaxID=335848 RepID=A0ABR1Q0P3_9PEZI
MWTIDLPKLPFQSSKSHEEEEECKLLEEGTTIGPSWALPQWIKVFLLASVLLNLISFGFILVLGFTRNRDPTQILYSPAREAVYYEVKKFHRGFGLDKTIYQGDPSPEVDAEWEALYDSVGIIRLDKSQAERLPNKTYPYVGEDDGYYIGELAVFHQLHCLNAIRISLSQDYYRTVLDSSHFDPAEGSYGRDHISHCLDALREAIMCASDISVITWKWNHKAQRALGHGDIVHTCRNFESIHDWSTKNHP